MFNRISLEKSERSNYISSYPHIADKTDDNGIKIMLGKRLKEVIKKVRGDYNRGAKSEMNIQTIGIIKIHVIC